MEKKADFWFGVYWGHSFLSLLIVLWSLIVLVVFFVLAFINEREWNFFLPVDGFPWLLFLQIWCPSSWWVWSGVGACGDAILWSEQHS